MNFTKEEANLPSILKYCNDKSINFKECKENVIKISGIILKHYGYMNDNDNDSFVLLKKLLKYSNVLKTYKYNTLYINPNIIKLLIQNTPDTDIVFLNFIKTQKQNINILPNETIIYIIEKYVYNIINI